MIYWVLQTDCLDLVMEVFLGKIRTDLLTGTCRGRSLATRMVVYVLGSMTGCGEVGEECLCCDLGGRPGPNKSMRQQENKKKKSLPSANCQGSCGMGTPTMRQNSLPETYQRLAGRLPGA